MVLSGGDTTQQGWIQLNLSGQVSFVANAVFQTYDGPTLAAEAGVLDSDQVFAGLVYVKSQAGSSNVGIAFANNNPSPTSVHVQLINKGTTQEFKDINIPAYGHLARYVTDPDLFPDLASVADFDGAIAMTSQQTFSAIALRLTNLKTATIPVAYDGIYRPAITGLTVTKHVAAPFEIDFTVNFADVDSNLATSSVPTVFGSVYLLISGQVYGPYGVGMDGTAVINSSSGTISGVLNSSATSADFTSLPSGTQVQVYVQIYDADGNQSNLMYLVNAIKF
jgi:hypothetical protein